MVYALLRDQAERVTLAERQVAATLAAGGAKRVQMPEVQQQWDLLDEALRGSVRRFDDLRDLLGA